MLSAPAWPAADWRDHNLEFVSLLPPEIKAKREQDRKQGIIIRIVIIFFVIAMAVYAFLLVSSIMARSNLESLRDERATLQNQAAALEEYEVLFNEMRAAEEVLNTAMGQAPAWNDLLQDLGLTLPVGVWLSDLNVSYAGEEGSFNMRGWTYTHSGVSDMLVEIENMEQLDDVRIRVSTETIYEGQDTVQFNVDAILLPGATYLEEDGEAS